MHVPITLLGIYDAYFFRWQILQWKSSEYIPKAFHRVHILLFTLFLCTNGKPSHDVVHVHPEICVKEEEEHTSEKRAEFLFIPLSDVQSFWILEPQLKTCKICSECTRKSLAFQSYFQVCNHQYLMRKTDLLSRLDAFLVAIKNYLPWIWFIHPKWYICHIKLVIVFIGQHSRKDLTTNTFVSGLAIMHCGVACTYGHIPIFPVVFQEHIVTFWLSFHL